MWPNEWREEWQKISIFLFTRSHSRSHTIDNDRLNIVCPSCETFNDGYSVMHSPRSYTTIGTDLSWVWVFFSRLLFLCSLVFISSRFSFFLFRCRRPYFTVIWIYFRLNFVLVSSVASATVAHHYFGQLFEICLADNSNAQFLLPTNRIWIFPGSRITHTHTHFSCSQPDDRKFPLIKRTAFASTARHLRVRHTCCGCVCSAIQVAFCRVTLVCVAGEHISFRNANIKIIITNNDHRTIFPLLTSGGVVSAAHQLAYERSFHTVCVRWLREPRKWTIE